MKKLTLPLLLVSAFLLVEPADAQVRFGVKAGVNVSNAKIQDNDSFDPLIGFQGSLMADISISSKFSIQSALRFVTKGFSSETEFRDAQGQFTGIGRSTFRTNYLELPVLMLYKVKIGESSQIFGGLGPYMAAGINGKSDFEGRIPAQRIVFGPKNDRPDGAYNRMDYGLAAAAGIERGRVVVAVNYNHGLTGISPDSQAFAVNFYNRSLGLTAGYWFGEQAK